MSLNIVVVVASKGRPETLAELAEDLLSQTLPAKAILFSVTGAEDLPELDAPNLGIRVLTGPPGSCRQRNAALDEIPDATDLVVFFDDDYVPESRALERIATFAAEHPEILGFDGALLADGIKGPGISREEARRLVTDHEARPAPPLAVRPCRGLYGCNMVFRSSAIGDLRFDERLPLYGWQEDVDFSARVARLGPLAKTNAFAGVHRGVKGGRTNGQRLGYSQVANPIYLRRKGTLTRAFAWRLMVRNLVANHVRLPWPEPWVDRRGRCAGNWLALADWVRGRLDPRKILSL